jgi:glycosyltransferase involved in cell wall biosynthesis
VPYYTAYLSRALLAEGVHVMVGSITYYLDPGCFTSRGLKLDPGMMDVVGKFPLPRLPRRVLKLAESLLNLFALWWRFLLSPPDVIHVQFLPMLKWRIPLDLWLIEFSRMRGAKIVLTVHDLLPHNTGETYKATFLELYRSADRMICHSDHIKDRLEAEFSVPRAKVFVIPHGPFFYDLPADGLVQQGKPSDADAVTVEVLWQGILSPYKGVDLLLHAWQQVEANCSNCRLSIVGTGAPEMLEQVRLQVERQKLEHVNLQLRFVSTQELVALYRAADVVVYPYRAITTSGALATGLALGKAIIASDLPVFRELLTDRENALLVDAQNPAALAGALLELAHDKALRNHLADRVREMNFGDQSWLSIAKKTLHVYEDALLSQQLT